MDNENFRKYIEEYIRNLDYETEELEILGASLNALGYLILCNGARIDIYDIITNNEVDTTSAEVTVSGQFIIVIGYIILLSVSIRRLYARELRNEYLSEKNFIPAYSKLEAAYTLSVLANLLRLESFNEILLNRENNIKNNQE